MPEKMTQKLIPLKVPWRVQFDIDESEFELKMNSDQDIDIHLQSQWISEYNQVGKEIEWESRKLHFRFECGWTRAHPESVYEPDEFDMSAVFPEQMMGILHLRFSERTDETDLQWTKMFKQWEQEWIKNHICGNPGIYHVEDSLWLDKIGLHCFTDAHL